MKQLHIFIALALFFTHSSTPRSPYRKQDNWVPHLKLSWEHGGKTHCLRNTYLGPYAYFFCYDAVFLYNHRLPRGLISYRNNPEKSVSGTLLKSKIKQVIKRLEARQPLPSDFFVLKDRDFNYGLCAGLLVLKFKDYPFVLKLFMERPETLVQPFSRGFEVNFVFFMGGGMNRHLGGLLRIKNLRVVSDRLAQHKHFKHIGFPRKWFWMPGKKNMIQVTGTHLGKGNMSARIPGTYALICDYIESERSYSILNHQDRTQALEICNYLEQWVDPHIDNFVIEKGTGKTIIIDTEHFPSMIGFNRPHRFQSYSQWYIHLIGKCFFEMYGRSKTARAQWQRARLPHMKLSNPEQGFSLLHL